MIKNLHIPSIIIDFVEYLPFFIIGMSIYKSNTNKYFVEMTYNKKKYFSGYKNTIEEANVILLELYF